MDEEMNTGGAPAPDTTPAPEMSTAPDASGGEHTQTEEHRVPDAAIQVDPDTGKRSIVFPSESAEQTGASQTEPPSQESEQASQVQPYNANDLVRLVATGQNIDPARVPQELEGYAAAIQQQRINAQMRQPQSQQAAQPQQPPQPTAEQIAQMQAQRAAAYEQITKLAEQKACQDLGVTKEQLEDAEYSDDEALQAKARAFESAVRFNVDAISNEIMRQKAVQVQQMQAQQRETQEAMQMILPKWEEYKRDPHYHDIDVMMENHYKSLPFEEGVKVKQSIDRLLAGRPIKADMDVLDAYYKRTKEAYYAKATGVGTTPQPAPQKQRPPRVEQPGQHGTPEQKQSVDWSKMRGMNPRQRSQFLQAYFR